MDKIDLLIQKGAKVINPQAVSITDDVEIDRLNGKGVTLYPGVCIRGANTFIAEGAQLGLEAPVTIENCYVGPEVSLKGGYFNGAVFLHKASCGLGSHVRQGTILEEGAGIAHTVGLKQTILFPFVTLGSLINFCDCLMSGGTDLKNHSEVGSSYIHFNFTPSQDKATPSLMGDVPRGVMINQAPIFLGGQGGLVGPCRIAFGTVIAAGTICRMDQLKENHLMFGSKTRSGTIPYTPSGIVGLKRILKNNFYYISNLTALLHWCRRVRKMFVGPLLPKQIFEGLIQTLRGAITERISQLEKMKRKLEATGAGEGLPLLLSSQWPRISAVFQEMEINEGDVQYRDRFLTIIEQKIHTLGLDYIKVIKNLSGDESRVGTQWLESIVEMAYAECLNCLDESQPNSE